MEEKFCIREAIDRYTARITRSIRSRRRRNEVRREYAEHIEDTVTEYMLSGMTEEEAFTRAKAELGDETKIGVLLQAVHNKDRLPALIRVPMYAIAFFAVLSAYFWIENRTFRAWYLFLGEILMIAALVVGVCFLFLFLRSICKRAGAYKRLKAYAKEHGYTLTKNSSVYASLLRKTTVPELTLDTGKVRYNINLWATVRKKKTLRLFDNGMYCYMGQVGYRLAFTDRFRLTSVGMGSAARFMSYLPMFHSDLFEVPERLHLMPDIAWQKYERTGVENVRVLLLNPIPMAAVGLEKSLLKPLMVLPSFCGMHVNSSSGFLSYLEGIRLKESGK
ncbi:MAG: hypothetical protein IJZ08_03555 [Clostridia bacterium]|nr:hypothetical protein [Clostridia bacterium]